MIVRHSLGEYPIEFCDLEMAVGGLPEDRVIVTDENVSTAWKRLIPVDERTIVLPPGETTKSLTWYAEVVRELARRRCSRKTTLVAIGGGVIGDLAGFCAASYMRGIKYVQIPTTLLAQVDSSVGGKVGVDLPEGKNLVGAFWPPTKVAICAEVLVTLPPRQFANGMAEVWKYGFILDADFVNRLSRKEASISEVLRHCIELKAAVVEADEFERLGIRAKLNFGHTIGHAIEKVLGYEEFLHGEAISIGMVAEAILGERLGVTAPGTTEILRDELESQGLPVEWSGLRDADGLIAAMKLDKKASSGRLAFSLLTRVGECKLIEDVPESDVRSVLSSL